eukprot:Skav228731  [mRNA]  locus=scaffold5196:22910:27289:+ [translate_table: standard]
MCILQALQGPHCRHSRVAASGLDPRRIAQVGQQLGCAPPFRWHRQSAVSQLLSRLGSATAVLDNLVASQVSLEDILIHPFLCATKEGQGPTGGL